MTTVTKTTAGSVSGMEKSIPEKKGDGILNHYDFENPYIVTRSGTRFHLLNPSCSEINIEDIAFSLSNICRFTGHVDFYSVAQHSLLVQKIVERKGGTKNEKLWALLHDSAEAYISDLNSPVKSTWGLAAYREVESRILWTVSERFGLGTPLPDIVTWADKEAFKAEVIRLFPEKIRRNDFMISDYALPSELDNLVVYPNSDIESTRTRFFHEFSSLS